MNPYNSFNPYMQNGVQQGYNQPFMPQYNPYTQMTMTQQPVQNQQRSYIPGREVNNVADISAMDVPMDVKFVVFPRTDGKVIYMRSWNANGTIEPKEYVLKETEPAVAEPKANESLDSISERLDRIEELLASRLKPYNSKPYQNNTKEGKSNANE